jgi:hypothetical protein
MKIFAKACQSEIRRCQNSEPLNPIGLKGETIDGIVIERNKYKQLLV